MRAVGICEGVDLRGRVVRCKEDGMTLGEMG
jgi:hypothetical protein